MKLSKLVLAMGVTTALFGMAHTAQADTVSKKITLTAQINDGIFVLLILEGSGPMVHELERRLRVTEPVIKFITVRTDEEIKRLDKIKKLREARKKTSAAAATAPVTPEAGGEPAPATA